MENDNAKHEIPSETFHCECPQTTIDMFKICYDEGDKITNKNFEANENEFIEVFIPSTSTSNSATSVGSSLSVAADSNNQHDLSETQTSLLGVPAANGPILSELYFTTKCFVSLDNLKSNCYFFPVLKSFFVELEDTSTGHYLETWSDAGIKKNITKVLERFQAPQLQTFEFIDRFHQGRQSILNYLNFNEAKYWEKPLVNFVMGHCDSLKSVTVTTWKSSVDPQMQIGEKYVFPELEKLSVSFWGYETYDHLTQRNNFWVALLLSQSNQLQNLKWCVSCSMSWIEDIVPVIKNNIETLKSLDMPLPIVSTDTQYQREFEDIEANYIFSIDCAVFCNATNLISLTLTWQYCFLKNLQFLPESLQEFNLFSMPVISGELLHLKNLRNLRQLSLYIPQFCRNKYNGFIKILREYKYGVNLQVLKSLLESRSLMTITTNVVSNCQPLENINHRKTRGLRLYGEDFSHRGFFYYLRYICPALIRSPKALQFDNDCSVYVRECLETIQKLNSETGQFSQDINIDNYQYDVLKLYTKHLCRNGQPNWLIII